MFLVVGLGNPGKQYENNRHNVGFRVIQALAEILGVAQSNAECQAEVAEGRRDSESIILAQPHTFVNASGESVRDLINKYDMSVSDIIVVHDDLDLLLGEIRVKKGGSSGGHKGVDSIIYHLESDGFGRVRIGIGRPPGRQDSADFVLSDFKKQEEEEMSIAVKEAADAVLGIIEKGLPAAMNEYNRKRSEES